MRHVRDWFLGVTLALCAPIIVVVALVMFLPILFGRGFLEDFKRGKGARR